MYLVCDNCKSKKLIEIIYNGVFLCSTCFESTSTTPLPIINTVELSNAYLEILAEERKEQILKLHKIKSKYEKEVKKL